MPNLNELEEFKRQLKKLAQEEAVSRKWGGPVYDELPSPSEASLSDIDTDALLTTIDTMVPSDEAFKTEGSGSAEPLDTVSAKADAVSDLTEDNSFALDDFLTSSDDEMAADGLHNNETGGLQSRSDDVLSGDADQIDDSFFSSLDLNGDDASETASTEYPAGDAIVGDPVFDRVVDIMPPEDTMPDTVEADSRDNEEFSLPSGDAIEELSLKNDDLDLSGVFSDGSEAENDRAFSDVSNMVTEKKIEHAEKDSFFVGADVADTDTADDEPAADIQKAEETGFDDSGFSLEENVLDTGVAEDSDDKFDLPDSFRDFSENANSGSFDSVIENSIGADEDSGFSISESDYFLFLDRLESFPLNVQLAIQNYIGNSDGSSDVKMEFIRLIIANAPLRKIVKKLEKLIDERIPIPRGFERRSVEEYEREKKTFQYWFKHRFLPVAVLTLMTIVMVLCISVLSWHFIYKPVTAESLYKAGYACLQENQYGLAIEKFDEAGEYKRKKRWYFAYARAFRAKKQFNAAEKMYNRLLLDFAYDKNGGLEYAQMLSAELRNYEKAERIIRRTVLDHHVNDSEGLLTLGDIYMDWAEEAPEKYAQAVKIYARLIELYGEEDSYLVRMMRYFIRTDKLAEVLPLKEYFLPRLSKLSAADITELGGYLLEKRYNPKPLDSEKLRRKIDDLRSLLEHAVQIDNVVPEAYYNLGQFFIYNRKPDAAVENLRQAVNRFVHAMPVTPVRIVRHVDSMRLLGNLLIDKKQYLDAQKIYAEALNIYGEYTAIKPLAPNRIIGQLYENYGNIDYFISHNFDAALDSYQHAVTELNASPSVYYRMGYIHYMKKNYPQAIAAMNHAYAEKPNDKNLLYSFGNVLFKRGDYFAAQAYYERLMEQLDVERLSKGKLFPAMRKDDAEFIERYMHAANNLGATLSRLSEKNGNSQWNARALALYAEATRAWDSLTRNPLTMIRSKAVGLPYLNIQNAVNPKTAYMPEIYVDIPMTLEYEKVLQQREFR